MWYADTESYILVSGGVKSALGNVGVKSTLDNMGVESHKTGTGVTTAGFYVV